MATALFTFPDLGIIHGGDLLHTTAPFIDYANGGSSRGWVGTMNGALALDWHTAIPGHGMLMSRRDVVDFRNQMELVRERMAMLIRDGLARDDAGDAIRDSGLSWTQAEQGLFMQRSIPGFYDESRGRIALSPAAGRQQSMESGEKSLRKLLASLAPGLLPDEYVFCTLPEGRRWEAAELPALATFREQEGLSLVLGTLAGTGSGLCR